MEYNFRTDTAMYWKLTDEKPIQVSKPDYARICKCCGKLTKERFIKSDGRCLPCSNGVCDCNK